MQTITVFDQRYFYQLGDRVELLIFAHQLSAKEGCHVNYMTAVPRLETLKSLFSFGSVSLNDMSVVDGTRLEISPRGYLPPISLDPITITKKTFNSDLKLPEKFVTAQWDAGEKKRRVDCVEANRIEKIENFYKQEGYEIVQIGGESEVNNLEDMFFALSKACFHIGANSGVGHLAQLFMPIENIHIYVNLIKMTEGQRLKNKNVRHDNYLVSIWARTLFARGAKMNFCENPSEEQIAHFKRLDPFIPDFDNAQRYVQV